MFSSADIKTRRQSQQDRKWVKAHNKRKHEMAQARSDAQKGNRHPNRYGW